jgi:hypothetical protein
MLIQEVLTDVPALEVIQRAREFFTLRLTPYGAFDEDSSDHHIKLATEAARGRRMAGRWCGAAPAGCTTSSRSS